MSPTKEKVICADYSCHKLARYRIYSKEYDLELNFCQKCGSKYKGKEYVKKRLIQ